MSVRAAVRLTGIDWYDEFDRGAGPLGRDWISGHTLAPTTYEEVGIYDGAFVCTDPTSRGGVYLSEDIAPEDTPHPPPDGVLYAGISIAVRQMPEGWTPDVEVVYAGNRGITGGSHVEAAPFLHADPTSPYGGFGAWVSEYAGTPLVVLGHMGVPPETFDEDLVAGVVALTHTPGDPVRLRLREISPGLAALWINGVRATVGSVDTWTIHESLLDSRLHGIAMDAHYVRPYSAIPTTAAVNSIRYRNVTEVTP